MKSHHLRSRGLCALLSGVLAACGAGDDLSRAIDGSIARTVTEPKVAAVATNWINVNTAHAGNDSLAHMPMSLCWLGSELLVADGARQRIEAFDSHGRHLRGMGRRGSGPGEFKRIVAVRCSGDGRSILAADAGAKRVSFLDAAGGFRYSVHAPSTPQAVPYLGDFLIANDGTWFDSWLASRVGPYLTDDEWKSVRLVRRWSRTGDLLKEFGEPFVYRNTVLRRVFNRTALTLYRDTLWVLSQANAALQGFDSRGEKVAGTVFLPVYHRGMDPILEVGQSLGGGFRRNRGIYQPNVAGIAVVLDTLFATIRYQDWEEVSRGDGEDAYTDFWPRSSIEIFDRRGKVLMALAVPGRPKAIASNGREAVAVLSEDFDTGVESVLIHSLSPASGSRLSVR